jgi:hypothetical protein
MSVQLVQLDAATIDAIADAVAERLREPASNGRLLTVAELADALNVSPSVIYTHADELGALRIGGGKRARLRFDLA